MAKRGRPTSRHRAAFGARLWAARERQGMTQQQLADALGVRANLVRYYERNVANPKIEVARKCAAALGVSLDELLGKAQPKLKPGPPGIVDQLMAELQGLHAERRRLAARVCLAVVSTLKPNPKP